MLHGDGERKVFLRYWLGDDEVQAGHQPCVVCVCGGVHVPQLVETLRLAEVVWVRQHPQHGRYHDWIVDVLDLLPGEVVVDGFEEVHDAIVDSDTRLPSACA